MHAGQHLLRRASIGSPRRGTFGRDGRSRGRLFFSLESGRNHGHDQIITDLGIDDLSDDDVRFGIRRMLNDRRRFFHFVQRHVRAACDIQQHSAGAFDAALFQQRDCKSPSAPLPAPGWRRARCPSPSPRDPCAP
jgi:hypothetical protein